MKMRAIYSYDSPSKWQQLFIKLKQFNILRFYIIDILLKTTNLLAKTGITIPETFWGYIFWMDNYEPLPKSYDRGFIVIDLKGFINLSES